VVSTLCLFFRIPYAAPILLVLQFLPPLKVKRSEKKKIHEFLVLAQQMRPALPNSAGHGTAPKTSAADSI
jgi:hypothetical protein